MDRLKVLGALALILLAGPAFGQGRTNNFSPLFGSGQSISATTTSASITLTGEMLNQTDLMMVNAGTDLVFCRWGIGAQTAVTSDVPIPTNTIVIFSKGIGTTVVACRSLSTTATVYILPGAGY